MKQSVTWIFRITNKQKTILNKIKCSTYVDHKNKNIYIFLLTQLKSLGFQLSTILPCNYIAQD